MSKKKPNGYWNRERIVNAFYDFKERLGRVPKCKEFGGGAVWAINQGQYDPNITSWNEFLIDIGEELSHDMDKWNKRTITKTFYEFKDRLGRVPTSEELPGSAINAIYHGRYNPKIKTWNGFLSDLKETVNQERDKWNRETIKQAFYELKEKLGRTPTSEDFRQSDSGAIGALFDGKYNPKIRSWNGFLIDLKEDIHCDYGKWKRTTNRQLINYINAEYKGKTIGEFQREDPSRYREIRRRGLIKRLVKSKILKRKKRPNGYFEEMTNSQFIDYVREEHSGRTINEFVDEDGSGYGEALNRKLIEKLVKLKILVREGKPRGFFENMNNKQVIEYVRKNHKGKSPSEIQRVDSAGYNEARERQLIDGLVKSGILIKKSHRVNKTALLEDIAGAGDAK